MKEVPMVPETVDAYIQQFPETTQTLLHELRQIIKCAAPDAHETISYKMPAFKLNGILVYFAGYKNHIGFYPTGSGISHFESKLSAYKTSKGTVQFPLNQALPHALIEKMVRYRVQEQLLKKQKKAKTL
jgi:uncharacterized protein YdhG (YjbR/CyaY superfamily)